MKQELFTCLYVIRNNSSNKAFCLSTSFFLCFIHFLMFVMYRVLVLPQNVTNYYIQLNIVIITIRKYNQLTSDIFSCFIHCEKLYTWATRGLEHATAICLPTYSWIHKSWSFIHINPRVYEL